tara:strand:+ start:724 stop:1404 length:681 start_codon:yes stop_codon:yes gene_type:complete
MTSFTSTPKIQFTRTAESDNYMTPPDVWEHIKHLVPKEKTIWEAFYGDGSSGQIWRDFGYDVIHKPVDFFTHDYGDIVVSNPPFADGIIGRIFERLFKLDKPFILLMPVQKIQTKYYAEAVKGKKVQIVLPPKRLGFQKWDAKTGEKKKVSYPVECAYYCYKINLPEDISFLRHGKTMPKKRKTLPIPPKKRKTLPIPSRRPRVERHNLSRDHPAYIQPKRQCKIY